MLNDKKIKKNIFQELISSQMETSKDLDLFRRQMAKKHRVTCLSNSDLLKIYHENLPKKSGKGRPSLFALERLLIKRPMRSLSGVVNVSVLTKPYPCPGKCIFCPTQKNIPKSYLAKEPAVQRAILNKFDPYQQVWTRLLSLKETGHPIDKTEIRIIGGTWSYYPKKYQEWFIAECFRACNEFGGRKITNYELRITNLRKEQNKNERAKCRVVSLAVETRPDYINTQEIKWMRELGITKVELGVQTVDDKILNLNQRGHGVQEIIEATRLLKNAGFKVSYQMMPNLYGSTLKKDLAVFKEIFTNPDFKPDFLKIYPLALVKNTQLYNLYQQGKFKPYSEKELTKLLIEIKKIIPRWIRVERIIRDIPSNEIVEGGSKILNLRAMVVTQMNKQGVTCQCIRCREVGARYDPKEKLYLFRENYTASGGQEIFLTFENKEHTKLLGLLRLRLHNQEGGNLLPENSGAIVRELHVFGQMTQITHGGKTSINSNQHKGLGKKLITEAEKIAKKFGYKKIAVISAIGARPYYRKLGYKLQNTYMVKSLN
ncbi:MAG: tRNA uridine(34) 5-carboxymethylaminomethyl modification radical SAM/GNAT enzyme Elp3 [Candidatus Gribaldobacteria bacterium]|nr:tRNA uridine(34) 5-carboxymethylaminomethyl modification radical SAM/GNAT enzyme Elp3 [Candidatus Gribaldobacteria bacterium]